MSASVTPNPRPMLNVYIKPSRLYIRSFASCYIFSVLFYSLFLFISHFLNPDILCYSNYCFSDLRAMSYFARVAIVPAAQALTMVSIRSKLMLQAIYSTCIKLMICNDTRTLHFMHHETRDLSYCCDVALLRVFWPIVVQLPLKAAPPLAEMIATASGRCSRTGPGYKLSPLLRSLWGTFQHLISLLTHFVSIGVLAVGRVLRRGAIEGTITWLDAGYARDVDCDLFRCGYNDRW